MCNSSGPSMDERKRLPGRRPGWKAASARRGNTVYRGQQPRASPSAVLRCSPGHQTRKGFSRPQARYSCHEGESMAGVSLLARLRSGSDFGLGLLRAHRRKMNLLNPEPPSAAWSLCKVGVPGSAAHTASVLSKGPAVSGGRPGAPRCSVCTS